MTAAKRSARAPMHIRVLDNREQIGRAASAQAIAVLRRALDERPFARMVAATGTSQFELIEALRAEPGIDWSRVELFHLDEYLGLPSDHPASFCRFIMDRLVRPLGIRRYHLLDGGREPADVIAEVGQAISAEPIDLTLCGIGENGHLAFNDPPADFMSEDPYLVVSLDEVCRRQQVGEGWFPDLSAVPTRAITMSIRQILRSREILCLAPDDRKAEAVRECFTDGITPDAPASALLGHPNTVVYLDRASAALLPEDVLAGLRR